MAVSVIPEQPWGPRIRYRLTLLSLMDTAHRQIHMFSAASPDPRLRPELKHAQRIAAPATITFDIQILQTRACICKKVDMRQHKDKKIQDCQFKLRTYFRSITEARVDTGKRSCLENVSPRETSLAFGCEFCTKDNAVSIETEQDL